MRYRVLASYQGAPYEAGVGPDENGVVLFAACPPPEDLQFEPATGHWRKRVTRFDVQMLYESRPVGIFRGERCVVLDDLGERLHIVYLGHDAYRAEQLGYWEVDRGVFELITPRQEVTEVVELRLPLPLRSESGQSARPDFPPSPGSPRVPSPSPDDAPLPLEAEAMRAATAATRRATSAEPDGHSAGLDPTPDAPSSPQDAPPVSPTVLDAPDPNASPVPKPVPVSQPPASAPPVSARPAGISDPPTAVRQGSNGAATTVPSWTPQPQPPHPPLPGPADRPIPAERRNPPAAAAPNETPAEAPTPALDGVAPPRAPQPIAAPPEPARPSADALAPAQAQPAVTPAPSPEAPAMQVVGAARRSGFTRAEGVNAAHSEPSLPSSAALPTAVRPPSAVAAGDVPATPSLTAQDSGLPGTQIPAAAHTDAQPISAQPISAQPISAQPDSPAVGRRRRATRQRLPTQRIFSDLASQAAISDTAYAIGEDVDGALCLMRTEEGFEVFNSAGGARHEVRIFDDEESAYFYLFGVLVAEAVRTGALAPRQ